MKNPAAWQAAGETDDHKSTAASTPPLSAGIQAPADLSKLADDIRSLLGVTVNDATARRRHAIRNAEKTAECCAKCQRPLKPEEPIWRAKHPIRYYPYHQEWIAPVCSDCRSEQDNYWDPVPCEGCGRPVHDRMTFQPRRLSCFCCERCTPAARAARARERRRLARSDRSCEWCGETFEPKRADAKFCSGACRQAAYRHRVTDGFRCTDAREVRGRP